MRTAPAAPAELPQASTGWTVSHVLPEQVTTVWPEIEPWIRRLGAHGMGHTLDVSELRESIEQGRRILWVVHRQDRITSCLVLEFVRHPSREIALRVVLVAGSRFWEWAETVQKLLIDYAELAGAQSLEAAARPGMARWVRRLGWTAAAVLVERRLGSRDGQER